MVNYFMLDNWISDIEDALYKTKGVDFKNATLDDIMAGNLARKPREPSPIGRGEVTRLKQAFDYSKKLARPSWGVISF